MGIINKLSKRIKLKMLTAILLIISYLIYLIIGIRLEMMSNHSKIFVMSGVATLALIGYLIPKHDIKLNKSLYVIGFVIKGFMWYSTDSRYFRYCYFDYINIFRIIIECMPLFIYIFMIWIKLSINRRVIKIGTIGFSVYTIILILNSIRSIYSMSILIEIIAIFIIWWHEGGKFILRKDMIFESKEDALQIRNELLLYKQQFDEGIISEEDYSKAKDIVIRNMWDNKKRI